MLYIHNLAFWGTDKAMLGVAIDKKALATRQTWIAAKRSDNNGLELLLYIARAVIV